MHIHEGVRRGRWRRKEESEMSTEKATAVHCGVALLFGAQLTFMLQLGACVEKIAVMGRKFGFMEPGLVLRLVRLWGKGEKEAYIRPRPPPHCPARTSWWWWCP